jgi:hypothetical protein
MSSVVEADHSVPGRAQPHVHAGDSNAQRRTTGYALSESRHSREQRLLAVRTPR